jgi:phospholipid/cholesterol/gamma-HCH transport system substrate-binding protein
MMRVRLIVAAVTSAVFALTGCGFHGLYSAPLPGGANLGSHPFQVTAEFADVLDLVPQSAVKVNDIAIGKVTTIVLEGWHAKVTMEVNNSVNLPANARAEILQTSLLGEKYIALMQPTVSPASTRLHSGSNIPLSRTRSAPEVEQVLGALSLLLNEGGLNQIKQIANELNAALHGNESKIRDLLTQLNTFVGTLDNQKNEITTALENIDVLARTLNHQKKILTSSLDIFPKALDVLSNERHQLVTLLTSLAHLGKVAGGVIDATQQQFISSLKSLQPVLDKLTAAGSNLPEALKIMGTFPFPLGTSREFVKGDYANLNAYINFDLSDTLCGLDNPKSDPEHLLCKVARKLPASVRHRKLTPNSNTESQLTPALVGAGG